MTATTGRLSQAFAEVDRFLREKYPDEHQGTIEAATMDAFNNLDAEHEIQTTAELWGLLPEWKYYSEDMLLRFLSQPPIQDTDE